VDSQAKTEIIKATLGRLQALTILEYFDKFDEGVEAANDATFEVRKAKTAAESFFNAITKHAVTLAEISEDERFALSFRNEKAKDHSVLMYGKAQNALDDVRFCFSELTRVVNKRATPRGPDSPELRELQNTRTSADVEMFLANTAPGQLHVRMQAVFNSALAKGDLPLCHKLADAAWMAAWLEYKGVPSLVTVYQDVLLPKFIDALLPASSKPYFVAQQKLPSLVTPVILLLEQALRHYIESLPTDAQTAIKQVSSQTVVTSNG
jgi:hypothetical protein